MCALRVRSFRGIGQAAIVALFLVMSLRSVAQEAAPQRASDSHMPAHPKAPEPAASQDLTTTIDEVSFDLSVRTKHNKPVLNLEPSQLTVTDDGSPIRFTSLHRVDNSSGSQHLITFLFDRLDRASIKSARKVVENILGAIPNKGYSIAIFQVDGRLRLLQPFTQDLTQIDAGVTEAISDPPSSHRTDFTPAEKAMMASLRSDTLGSGDHAENRLIFSALEQSQHILEERRSYPSLAALQALVQSNRLVTGRKFIFYVSAGIDGNSDARDILRSIVGLANRAGVTIWAIDTSRVNAQMSSSQQSSIASSILGTGPAGSSGGVSAFGSGNLPGSTPAGTLGPSAGLPSVAAKNIAGFAFGDSGSDQSPLVSLAFGTGGMYIGTVGGYKHQLQRLNEDLTSWYEVTWKPPIKTYDGQFRPVVIHSLSKGVKIRARSGYFAVPPSEDSGIQPFEVPLLNALAGPVLPADLAFRSRILHLGRLTDGNSSELVVQVPVSQLTVHEDANTRISSVHAAIVAVIQDSKGTVLERFGEDFPLHEASGQLRDDPSQAITLEEHFSGDPGVYTLETAVMDRIGNKTGAQRTTFTIEPPVKSPSISDIALVDSVEPVQEDSQSFDPMLYSNGRIIPNLATELPEDTHSLSFFFLLHPVADATHKPALRMKILYGGQLITETPMEFDKASDTGAAIPYFATIHGHIFPPGEYEVKALLSQEGSTASSTVSFRVAGTADVSNVLKPDLAAVGNGGSGAHVVSEAVTANSQFVIANPQTPLAPPSDAEIQSTIEEVRQRALGWSNSLANFMCIEITNHSVDVTGSGIWKHKDTLVERMTYVDHLESRSTLMLNGERSSVEPDHFDFLHSAGEFGAIFHIVFDPAAKTSFNWKQYALLDGQTVQVYAFRVAIANSGFELKDRAGESARVGFHGLLYIDSATRSVRRISLDADDIPAKLNIRASSVSVDYSWISMQEHDFLLPVRGAVSLQEYKRRPVLNEFEFLDYHRFGSHSRILSSAEPQPPAMN